MTHRKRFQYLRVSLTSECNLRCFYCRPARSENIKRPGQVAAGQFASAIELLYRAGVRKVRFTGGEPTLYKALPELITHAKHLDRKIHTAITTNGRLLERLSPRLAEAGLDSVNISLDSLDPMRFRAITSVDSLNQVLKGISTAIHYIPEVKLNCVVVKGINDDEADSMIKFANDLGIDIRFIEYMPTRYNSCGRRGFLSNDLLRANLSGTYYPVKSGSVSAAKYYRSPALNIRVGFISPISHPFCGNCNRIRLASDGMLYGCLFSNRGISLFSLLERGTAEALEEIDRLSDTGQIPGYVAAIDKPCNLPSFYLMGG